MKRCIIIGKPNAGKTLFTLNFAAYLGTTPLHVAFRQDNTTNWKTYRLDEAVQQLTSSKPHHTLGLQELIVTLPARKGAKRIQLIDTCGLVEGIPAEQDIRRAMAATLAAVRDAHLILHIIDASRVKAAGTVEALGEVDYQVAQFGQLRDGYLILANKIDLPEAKEGLDIIAREFAAHQVIPISALYQQGFKAVKQFVQRHI
ncbi:MAG: GTP-binding protein HSR1 [Firmicutes bacterium]|nr:GTP-binding protein HSR1 [Bacillota bacterium]